jgi:signal transduction histidine kinase
MTNIQQPIITIKLDNELDIVLAYKRAMQIAEMSGLSFTDQTKFATAVSEISRNVLEHANNGSIELQIHVESSSPCLKAVISDQGKGIDNIEELLNSYTPQRSGKGLGIHHSRRLVDFFEITSIKGQGTTVQLSKKLSHNHPPINHLILSGWRKHFSTVAPISPYDEIKRQNHLLLDALDTLKVKNSQIESQLHEITTLNNELESNYARIKELSEESEQQNKLLKKRNEDLDNFAYIVSHDLKAPLKNIEGLINLLSKNDASVQHDVIGMLQGQLTRVNKLINNILSYGRAGRDEVEKSHVNLYDFLKELSEQIARPEHIEIIIENTFPALYTEEVYLYQIFSNLISNAIKYNDKKSGIIRIGHIQDETGTFSFYVEDNGPGIPKEKHEQVFKMFVMLGNKKLPENSSSGLGLAIVKKIVEEKGGRIWIENNKTDKTGTRFIFTWPAQVVE